MGSYPLEHDPRDGANDRDQTGVVWMSGLGDPRGELVVISRSAPYHALITLWFNRTSALSSAPGARQRSIDRV
jgi:hypothetical protein